MNTKIALLALFVLTISCGNVVVKNHEWCGDMGGLGASCFNTLSDDTRDVGPYQWSDERVGMVCGKSEAFTNLTTALLKACHTCKCCTFDVKKNALRFNQRVENFDLKLKENGLYDTL